MPAQKPNANQVVGTPWSFIAAACARLGITHFVVDLAATPENAKAETFLGPSPDGGSLAMDWTAFCGPGKGWGYLNPEFSDIGSQWAPKAEAEWRMGALFAMLVPTSTGAVWWMDHVAGKAHEVNIVGRIIFEGQADAYPKDLTLLLWIPGVKGGRSWWRWQIPTRPKKGFVIPQHASTQRANALRQKALTSFHASVKRKQKKLETAQEASCPQTPV